MNTQKHVFYGAEGRYVAEVDFDRVTAERDALQQLLNARDEEVGKLRNLLVATKEHVEFSVDYWASNEKSDFGLIESIRTMENQA